MRAIAATYNTDVEVWKLNPKVEALKLNVSLIPLMKAPLSRPLMSEFIESATPESRTFLIMEVTWLLKVR